MRNPNAYGVPVYGAPSPREEVEVERKPCSKHRPLCIVCGMLDDDPLSDEIVAAVRAYQKSIVQFNEQPTVNGCDREHRELWRLLEEDAERKQNEDKK